MMTDITIPNKWNPYPHQIEAVTKFDQGKKKQFHVWHRRAGKDNFCLNVIAKEAVQHVGTYWVVYPTQTHARSAVWLNIDSDGIRMIDHVFPPDIVDRKQENEMTIELFNGSIIRLMGADSDKLVGANPIGIVFSEWALCDPTVYDYVRPILKVNKGWVIFITTYRGKNHAYKMYNTLKANPDWFCTTKTIDDTGILTEADMDEERREGMSDAMINQEYRCSPMAAYEGAYFTNEMIKMQQDGRLTEISYDRSIPMYAAFDLGHSGRGDETVCVYIQDPHNTPKIIHSEAWRQHSIPMITEEMNKYPWASNMILLLPHDGKSHESGTGKSREDMYKEGLTNLKSSYVVSRPQNIQNSIEQLRQMLDVCYINNKLLDDGNVSNFTLTEALSVFRAEPTKHGIFTDQPIHDWSSHWVAAMRTYAGYRSYHGNTIRKKPKVLDYSRLNKAHFG